MTISINGAKWGIYKANRGNRIFLMPDGKYTIGICDLLNRKIYIADGLDKDLEQEVVQHEICHAINSMTGYYTDVDEEEKNCIFVGKFADETYLLSKEILKYL